MKSNSVTKKFGKLLRIDASFGDKIETIKITGDFFIHPEDTLDQIVDFLTGISVPLDEDFLAKELNFIIDGNEAQLIGISVDNIIETLEEVTQ